jgi:hypothetical protein
MTMDMRAIDFKVGRFIGVSTGALVGVFFLIKDVIL